MGVALGATAGLLIRFGRRRPRLATGVALAILFAFASEPGRQFALDLVTWAGWRLRYLLVPWSISDDQISITGMILGAIAGAVVAGFAMYATRHGRRRYGIAFRAVGAGDSIGMTLFQFPGPLLLTEGPIDRKEWIEKRLQELAGIFAVDPAQIIHTPSVPSPRNISVARFHADCAPWAICPSFPA